MGNSPLFLMFTHRLLHLAIIWPHKPVAKTLIKLAPNPSYLNIQNDIYLTPMHLAVLTEQAELVRDLVIGGAKVRIVYFHFLKWQQYLNIVLKSYATIWRPIHTIFLHVQKLKHLRVLLIKYLSNTNNYILGFLPAQNSNSNYIVMILVIHFVGIQKKTYFKTN